MLFQQRNQQNPTKSFITLTFDTPFFSRQTCGHKNNKKWKNVTKVFWRLYDNDKAILDGQFLDKKVEISETQKLIFTLTSCGQCHKTISLQRNASLYYEIMHNG